MNQMFKCLMSYFNWNWNFVGFFYNDEMNDDILICRFLMISSGRH